MKGTCPFGQVLFCISKNAFDVLETKTSHNMRLFADLFGYSTIISYFAAEFAALYIIFCRTKYECIMYIHERDNWTNFRWDTPQVSLLREKVFRKLHEHTAILEIRRYLSVKKRLLFFFYFMEFLYLCRGFHILHPRCTQGVAKV